MQPMPPILQKIVSSAQVRRIPKGQTIVYEGDPTPEVFIIKRGVIKLHSLSDDGKDRILHLLSPPAVMPLSFFSSGNRPARWRYTTLSNCDLYVFRKEQLRRAIERDCDTTYYLLDHFTEEMHEVLVRIDNLGKSNVETKLSATLRYLVVCHGEKERGSWWRIPFATNHQLLADMIGATRESTSTVMRSLAERKIVRYPRFAQLEINANNLQSLIQSPSSNG